MNKKNLSLVLVLTMVFSFVMSLTSVNASGQQTPSSPTITFGEAILKYQKVEGDDYEEKLATPTSGGVVTLPYAEGFELSEIEIEVFSEDSSGQKDHDKIVGKEAMKHQYITPDGGEMQINLAGLFPNVKNVKVFLKAKFNRVMKTVSIVNHEGKDLMKPEKVRYGAKFSKKIGEDAKILSASTKYKHEYGILVIDPVEDDVEIKLLGGPIDEKDQGNGDGGNDKHVPFKVHIQEVFDEVGNDPFSPNRQVISRKENIDFEGGMFRLPDSINDGIKWKVNPFLFGDKELNLEFRGYEFSIEGIPRPGEIELINGKANVPILLESEIQDLVDKLYKDKNPDEPVEVVLNLIFKHASEEQADTEPTPDAEGTNGEDIAQTGESNVSMIVGVSMIAVVALALVVTAMVKKREN